MASRSPFLKASKSFLFFARNIYAKRIASGCFSPDFCKPSHLTSVRLFRYESREMSDSDDLPGLSARQAEVYTFISRHIAASGYPPTIREIGVALGIRSTNGVADHLKALKR